ncbi:sodium- and chloride-dependent glycine transporter 1-like [Octopus sinensis]|uniref:Sodium- and chloride-dependent glycine transporter 1-like n=1 Tax=Octopus sinensis TaxID=2607531 RepID=A0A6P7TA61_9MOLL|nr:sodium- and chloride-dependent glycine transporter 1-like [Octopus sinensis]
MRERFSQDIENSSGTASEMPRLRDTVVLPRPGRLLCTSSHCSGLTQQPSLKHVWSDAATQVFYSLSISCGGLITMSSYNKFNNNCLRDSILVPLIDCFTSFFSGFVIFTVLGFMAKVKGVDVETVVKGGPGLAFIAYPEAITKMPSPTVWAILFFLMMITIGFSSQFSLVETVMSSLMDEWQDKLRRNWKTQTAFRVCVCLVTFLFGLPMTTQAGMYILNLVDTSVGGFPFLFIGLTECLTICYIYGYKRFADDIEMMLGKKPSVYWRICWCFVTPFILFVVIVSKAIQYKVVTLHSYVYPRWAQTIGWLIVIIPLVIIPVYFVVKHCQSGGYQVMVKSLKPLSNWGPSEPENRTGKYAEEADDDDSGSRGGQETTAENVDEVQRREMFTEVDGVENEAFEGDTRQNVTDLPNSIATTNSKF